MSLTQMRSLRLTHSLRYGIIKAAIEELYGEEAKKLDAVEVDFAKRLYATVYSEERLEECRRNNVRRQLFGIAFEIHSTAGRAVVYYLYGYECYSNVSHVVTDDDLHAEFMKNSEARQKLNTARDELESSLRTLLNSCSTTKQLLEYWPDCKKYIPEVESKVTGPTERDRRLAAAKVAGIFLDAGIDVVTPTEVEPDADKQDQAA